MNNCSRSAFTTSLLLLIYTMLMPHTWSDTVYNENVIVQGNACIGFDCITDEVFNADVFIVKENNLRIVFEDYTAANIDLHSMQITANDAADAGLNHFSFDYLFDQDGDNTGITSSSLLRVTSELDGSSMYVSSFILGKDSTETQGAISVGNSGMLRQLKHLAEGIGATDALMMEVLTSFDVMANQKLLIADIQLQITRFSQAITDLETQASLAESADFDGDGINDYVDLDDDNDGTLDTADAFPMDASEQLDTDGDGIGNNADTDDDNDGVLDSANNSTSSSDSGFGIGSFYLAEENAIWISLLILLSVPFRRKFKRVPLKLFALKI